MTDSQDSTTKKLISILSNCQSIKCSFATVIKLNNFFKTFNLYGLAKAAKLIKDYKQAITLFEIHINNKSDREHDAHFEDVATPDEIEFVTYCYKKVFHEEYTDDGLNFDQDIEAGRKSLSSNFANHFNKQLEEEKDEVNEQHTDASLEQLFSDIDKSKYQAYQYNLLKEFEKGEKHMRLESFDEVFVYDLSSLNVDQITIDFTSANSEYVLFNFTLMMMTKFNKFI